MTVPEGFSVELVASEPDIVNPVAMTFDERGRIWITESLEYPRHEAGPGQDRIKILEDTDGDGRADKFTVFADGLNIPSGIAVGAGGVWVVNAPDLLFLQDTDGDGRADRREVVLTGFGRNDTHELPNSLTWGPDGWLYGLNGVFNRCHVQHQGRDHDFTCALFRIHPRTRAFELFAEGTSNPWGVAWDSEGSAFVSACVIDHLWHLTETGYYIRQGGPYPPFTSIIGSIVTPSPSKGRLLRHPLFRQRRLSARVSPAALHGQHPRRLPECRPAGARRFDVSWASNAPTFSRPTTPGSCPWCKRPGPTAACTFSIGTIATIAIRTPAAIRRGSIGSRAGSIAFAITTRRTPRRSIWRRRATSN